MTQEYSQTLKSLQDKAKDWLLNEAAPLWSSKGVLNDKMFAELVTLDGETVFDCERRLRVQPRQIYSFCLIGELGWNGNWREICNNALDVLLAKGFDEKGLAYHRYDKDGNVSNPNNDLYDNAFCMFALGYAGKVLNRPDATQKANEIRDYILNNWRRPEGGFHEGNATISPPYRQNPHMHSFEASYMNYSLTGDKTWGALKDEIANLCINKFIDKESGALIEYFDQNWVPLANEEGKITEPGHCFEWAWLFESAMNDEASFKTSDSLVGFARKYGIDESRKVAINESWLDGSVKINKARLWPQTERLKAATARYNRLRNETEAKEIIASFEGLFQYFETGTKGTWYDKMNEDGSFVIEPSPASSFYHIACAIGELLKLEV